MFWSVPLICWTVHFEKNPAQFGKICLKSPNLKQKKRAAFEGSQPPSWASSNKLRRPMTFRDVGHVTPLEREMQDIFLFQGLVTWLFWFLVFVSVFCFFFAYLFGFRKAQASTILYISLFPFFFSMAAPRCVLFEMLANLNQPYLGNTSDFRFSHCDSFGKNHLHPLVVFNWRSCGRFQLKTYNSHTRKQNTHFWPGMTYHTYHVDLYCKQVIGKIHEDTSESITISFGKASGTHQASWKDRLRREISHVALEKKKKKPMATACRYWFDSWAPKSS